MDQGKFDGITRLLARQTNRRAVLRQVGYAGAAAGLLTMTGGIGGSAAASARVASSAQAAGENVPLLTPFHAAVRQGPSAGTEYLGFLALNVDESGAATGGFMTTEEAAIPVTGQITGQAVSLLFTPAEDTHIYGVGVTDQPLVGLHGYSPVAMGGPLVGPGDGDAGDWVVPSVSLIGGGRRSAVCKSCLQSCRNGFGFGTTQPPEPGVCQDICIQFGDAGYGGCSPLDFG